MDDDVVEWMMMHPGLWLMNQRPSCAGPYADRLRDDHIIVSCTKGILNDTLETVNEVMVRILPSRLHRRLAYLSGPSFAAEVPEGKPTAVTIASEVRRAVACRVSGFFNCLSVEFVASCSGGIYVKVVGPGHHPTICCAL